jgi:hypothetical protein
MDKSNRGNVALEAAAANGIKFYNGLSSFRAVVTCYSWCGVYTGTIVHPTSPRLIFNGANDPLVSPRECKNIK